MPAARIEQATAARGGEGAMRDFYNIIPSWSIDVRVESYARVTPLYARAVLVTP